MLLGPTDIVLEVSCRMCHVDKGSTRVHTLKLLRYDHASSKRSISLTRHQIFRLIAAALELNEFMN